MVHVHIGGLISPAIDRVRQLCRERELTLIEDAAHAHGSTLDGRWAGAWARGAAFSFYPTKVVTSAEGGMILTSDPAVRDDIVWLNCARLYHLEGAPPPG